MSDLIELLSQLADIHCARLDGAPVRVTLAERPVIEIDLDSPPEARCWDLLTAAMIILCGPDAVPGARTVRSLHSVS